MDLDYDSMLEYSLRFLVAGMPDFLVYQVEREDSERLEIALARPESKICNSPFFCFPAKYGLSVALSMPDIQMVNFLWDPPETLYEKPETKPGDTSEIIVHFRGNPEPVRIGISDPQELGRLFFYLDTVDLEEEPFLYFRDEEGEDVALRASRVVLLTAPSRFVEYESEAQEAPLRG